MKICPECDTEIALENKRIYTCSGCHTILLWDGMKFVVRSLLPVIPVIPDTRPYKQRGTLVLSRPIPKTTVSGTICVVCERGVEGINTTYAQVTFPKGRKVTKEYTKLSYNGDTKTVNRIQEVRELYIPEVKRGAVCTDCLKEHSSRVKLIDQQPQKYNQRQRGDKWSD